MLNASGISIPVKEWDRLSAESRDENEQFESVLKAFKQGDFNVRLDYPKDGILSRAAELLSDILGLNEHMTAELVHVGTVVGREGKMYERASVGPAEGAWATAITSVNQLIADLVSPTTEVARVITAVARGALSEKWCSRSRDGRSAANFCASARPSTAWLISAILLRRRVTRVAKEVGTEGELGGQAEVKGVSGSWEDLTDNVNFMAANLTKQVRGIVKVVTAVANGDLSQKFVLEAKGEVAALAETTNNMTNTLRIFADQVSTVAREVGIEGKLGGQAKVPGAQDSGQVRSAIDRYCGVSRGSIRPDT